MLQILQGDAFEKLRELPDESVHCCVTSPPYWGLRDYGTASWEGGDDGCDHVGIESRTVSGGDGKQYTNEGSNHVFSGDCKCGAKRIDSQLGLEKTPEEYVAKMVEVFREVRRVLRKDGTLWLNLGDSYAGSGKGPSGNIQSEASCIGSRGQRINSVNGESGHTSGVKPPPGLKSKDLVGIPWMVAFALRSDGWYLRQDIIWAKPNPMPESVTDRCTKAHEYLFLLTKSARYFYDADAIKEKVEYATIVRSGSKNNGSSRKDDGEAKWQGGLTPNQQDRYYKNISEESGRNKRSVWTVATAPYPEAHFATYPPDLIKPCILAGTSAKGCCAKCGAPWERIVESSKSFESGSGRAGNMPNGKQDLRASETNSTPDIRLGPVVSTKTIGWQPTCKCCSWHEPKDRVYCVNHPEGFFAYKTEPCMVLDPFAGSGTTGQVALELGRKAILIELNPKYVELIQSRCNVTPGLQLA